jgi:hypothetical protein
MSKILYAYIKQNPLQIQSNNGSLICFQIELNFKTFFFFCSYCALSYFLTNPVSSEALNLNPGYSG